LERFVVGEYFGKIKKRKIREVIPLPGNWYLLKTDNTKSANDFLVKTVYQIEPLRYFTPKHAHFAIDFYGKMCADRGKAMRLFGAIVDVWRGQDVREVISLYNAQTSGLPGYSIEYILYALKWILQQEDINFRGRSDAKQRELDGLLSELGISTPKGREGSQLAMSLLCNIARGTHPVEALIQANVDIIAIKKSRGTK